MTLKASQRNLLFLGMVLLTALLPLVGGFHHHHDGASGPCWFCVTASVATLPAGAILIALAIAYYAYPKAGRSATPCYLWMAPARRGPPIFSIA